MHIVVHRKLAMQLNVLNERKHMEFITRFYGCSMLVYVL